MIYADSSLIVSLYIQDALTHEAMAAMVNVHVPIAFTGLQRLEIRNAFNLAVFRNRITQSESDTAWSDFISDYRAGKYIRSTLNWPATLRDAFKLANTYSLMLGTRSLDILHVAAARWLGVKTFITFDKRQRSLAQAAGLQVLP